MTAGSVTVGCVRAGSVTAGCVTEGSVTAGCVRAGSVVASAETGSCSMRGVTRAGGGAGGGAGPGFGAPPAENADAAGGGGTPPPSTEGDEVALLPAVALACTAETPRHAPAATARALAACGSRQPRTLSDWVFAAAFDLNFGSTAGEGGRGFEAAALAPALW